MSAISNPEHVMT